MNHSLFLSLSDLSSDEYDAYIGALHDLLDYDDQGNIRRQVSDEELVKRQAPLVAIRTWGRYRSLKPDVIEQVRILVHVANLWATTKIMCFLGVGALHAAASGQADVRRPDPGCLAVAHACSLWRGY